jgi:hypothetical protein
LEADETDADDSSFPDLQGAQWDGVWTLWVAARCGSLQAVARLLAQAQAANQMQIVNQKDAYVLWTEGGYLVV